MKKFNDFINENIVKSVNAHFNDLKIFTRYINRELEIENLKTIVHSDIVTTDHNKISSDSKYSMYIQIDDSVFEGDLDVPDFFIKLKEFFKPYYYIKTYKKKNYSNFYIYLDFNKLVNSEIYWNGVLEEVEYIINKGSEIDIDEVMENLPIALKDNYKNRIQSLKGINKYKL